MGLYNSITLLLNVYFAALFTFSLSEDLCKNADPCRCVLSNNGSVIDLSTVGGDDWPRFYYVPLLADPDNETHIVEGLYSYNPCNPFTEKLTGVDSPASELPCKNAAACKLTVGQSNGSLPTSFAIGLQAKAHFFQKGQDIFIGYTTSPPSTQNLTVKLVCNSSANVPSLTISLPAKENQHEMTLSSKCACADEKECITTEPVVPGKEGLSTGSVLLITFFTILIVYLLCGMLWNFCNGAHGQELVPHIGFWNDIPQLVVDGFLFTCSCCSKRSQSTYSDM